MIANSLRWIGYAGAAVARLALGLVAYVCVLVVRYDIMPHPAERIGGPVRVLQAKTGMPNVLPTAK
jgi:hypothetical protein